MLCGDTALRERFSLRPCLFVHSQGKFLSSCLCSGSPVPHPNCLRGERTGDYCPCPFVSPPPTLETARATSSAGRGLPVSLTPGLSRPQVCATIKHQGAGSTGQSVFLEQLNQGQVAMEREMPQLSHPLVTYLPTPSWRP